MANSRKFFRFYNRLLQLRRHFLPKNFSPTGLYSIRQLDLARAYRLLSHAEIEGFIEVISKEIIIRSVGEWKIRKKPSDVIICLLSAYHSGWIEKDPDAFYSELVVKGSPVSRSSSADAAVDAAVNQYMARLKSNNGIKEQDIKKILLPVGIRNEDLDITWLSDMNDHGRLRGEIAHDSVSVASSIDPKTELDRVERILAGLKSLDITIHRMK